MTDNEFNKIIYTATTKFKGNLNYLENSIGMLSVGRRFGWKVLYLAHSKTTIRKYEKILDIKIRDVLSEESDLTNKSIAWKALKKVTNFWKAVSGEIPGIRSPNTN